MRTTKKSPSKKLAAFIAATLLTAGISLTGNAQSIVYDNSSTYQGQFHNSAGTMFGDQIDLAGTDRQITEFQFEYFLGAGASGDEQLSLQLLSNDGSGGAPNSVLYDSGAFSIAGTSDINTVTFGSEDFNNVTLDNSLTWAVQFEGIDAGEDAGLLLYDPPTTGDSFNDFWELDGGTWTLKDFGGGDSDPVANFGARVTAVPEPSVFGLGILAGLAGLGFAGVRRFKGKA